MAKDPNDRFMQHKMHAYRSRSVTATSDYWKKRKGNQKDANTDGSAAKGKRRSTEVVRVEARVSRQTRRGQRQILRAKATIVSHSQDESGDIDG